MGSTINHFQLNIEKLVIKKIKLREAKGNEIKELNYLVDYIDNSIEKYIEVNIQAISTRDGKPVEKNHNFSNYTDLWLPVKKYLKENYQ